MLFRDKEFMEKLDEFEKRMEAVEDGMDILTGECDAMIVRLDMLLDELGLETPTTTVYADGKPYAILSKSEEHAKWCGGEEIWLQYYHGPYPTSIEVSNYGNVRNFETKKPSKISRNANNIPRAWFAYTKDGVEKCSSATICNMVATMFIDRTLPVGFRGVSHIDENIENNHVDNLVIK